MLECMAYVCNQQRIHLCYNFGVSIDINLATTRRGRCDSNMSRRPSCFHTYCLLLGTKVDWLPLLNH